MISPDLTREDPGAPPNLDPITARHDLGLGPRRGVVYALAPSHLAEGDLWAGTDDGLIWRTRDDGGTWENVTPAPLTPWSKVGVIEPSSFDVDTAYAAVDRHRLDDRRPYIYRTTDGGKTWVPIVDGIDPGHFVNAVREDPGRKGLLYAATEEGVYVSFDDGEQWQSLQLGLPVTSVRDLVVHEDDLVIATHGRGIWILDDASPLRQIDTQVTESPVWLYAPAVAYRVRRPRFTGTPLPKDEPTAPNPPLGARIDYYLAAEPGSPITLEIRDGSGAAVRRYSSADAAPQADLSRLRMAPQWFVQPVVLSGSPGMHRFIWPLRYAAPTEISKDDPFHDGVWAPPGTYTVVLTVEGREWSQPLRVEPDPRVLLDADDYRQQFDLARAIETASARVAAATNDAQTLVSALVDRRAKVEGDLGTTLDTYLEEVRAVQGVRPAPNPNDAWAFPPRRLDSLRWVGGALSDLLRAVDGADAAPSPDAREGYEKLQATVEAALASWQGIATQELESVNRALIAAGVEPIELQE